MIEAISEATATARIQTLGKTSAYPALSADELTRCVEEAKRRDVDGEEPYQPNATTGLLEANASWIPTFDVAAGVALAWRLKSGSLLLPDVKAGPQAFTFSQMAKTCEMQIAYWEAQIDMAGVKGTLKTYEHLDVEPDEYPQPNFNFDGVRRA